MLNTCSITCMSINAEGEIDMLMLLLQTELYHFKLMLTLTSSVIVLAEGTCAFKEIIKVK